MPTVEELPDTDLVAGVIHGVSVLLSSAADKDDSRESQCRIICIMYSHYMAYFWAHLVPLGVATPTW
jgi:hypothetical protein